MEYDSRREGARKCQRLCCPRVLRVQKSTKDARHTTPVFDDPPTETRAIHTSLRKNRETLPTNMLIPRKAFGALTFLLCVVGIFIFSNSIVQWSAYVFGSHAPLIPYTTHVVLLQFKEPTSAIAVKSVRNAPERIAHRPDIA